MTAISKNVYIDKLGEIVDKYNNRTIKMKPADVKLGMFIEYGVDIMRKMLCHEYMLVVITYENSEREFGTFCEKELQKTSQKIIQD